MLFRRLFGILTVFIIKELGNIFFAQTSKPTRSHFRANKNNTISSPVFFGQWFNNLPRAALLTSLFNMTKFLSKFGEQQLVMGNYACGFNQSETGKYF